MISDVNVFLRSARFFFRDIAKNKKHRCKFSCNSILRMAVYSYIVVYYNSCELFEYLLALLAINYYLFVFIIFMSRAVKTYLAFKDAGFGS